MSVTIEMAFMIFEGVALVTLIAIGLFLLRRPAARSAAQAAAGAKTPSARLGHRGDGHAEPNGDEEPPPQGAPTAEEAAALPAASEALVAAIGRSFDEKLRALGGDLERWARESATDAATRRLVEALPGIERKIAEEVRPAVTEVAHPSINMQRPATAASPREPGAPGPAATAVRAAAKAAERPVGPESAADQPRESAFDRAAPAASSGVVLSRAPDRDAFAEASAWLTSLGVDEEEEERLRADCAALEPSEVVRKLFTGLHKITSERRLAYDRPKLSWARVGEARLAAFVREFHSDGTVLIWPRVGDSFDPRTMLPVFKEESGGGSVTEVVAPGYSGETPQDAVKALVVY